MNSFDLDLLHAWASGRLAPAEARAFEASLAADPALQQEAEAYRDVVRATEPLSSAAPASRLTFEALPLEELHLEESAVPLRPAGGLRRWIPLAAAALVLAAVSAWWFGGLGGTGGSVRPESANVVLAAIPLASEPPEPPAALLKGYAPARPDRTEWLTKTEEARAVARYVGRPVFVYAHYAECPLCRQMDAKTFPDDGVRALLARFVPLQLDAEGLSEDEVKRMFSVGWPYLAVELPDGTLVKTLPGLADAATLKKRLEAALAGQPTAALTWEEASRRAQHDAASRTGRAALLAARETAPSQPARARDDLRRAATELAGSDAGKDLDRVLAAWAPDAPFPVLEEAHR